MNSLKSFNILDVITEIGEQKCQTVLDSYICPINPDVEKFIRYQALEFARQRIAITYLIVFKEDDQLYLLGYFTLANKFVKSAKTISVKPPPRKLLNFRDTIKTCTVIN